MWYDKDGNDDVKLIENPVRNDTMIKDAPGYVKNKYEDKDVKINEIIVGNDKNLFAGTSILLSFEDDDDKSNEPLQRQESVHVLLHEKKWEGTIIENNKIHSYNEDDNNKQSIKRQMKKRQTENILSAQDKEDSVKSFTGNDKFSVRNDVNPFESSSTLLSFGDDLVEVAFHKAFSFDHTIEFISLSLFILNFIVILFYFIFLCNILVYYKKYPFLKRFLNK
jgi:hypothetical protein